MMNHFHAHFRRLLALIFWLGFAWLTLSRAGEAQAATAGKTNAEGWVTVPAAYLSSRLVRAPQVPATVYRVVLDVPPARSAEAAKPKVIGSCGDGAVDGIAWDYVKTVLAGTPALREQNATRELRFQLKLTPTPLDVSRLKLPPEYTGISTTNYRTPPPPNYPEAARRARITGSGRIRVNFPAGGGTPLRVTLIESTGSQVLDVTMVQWSMLVWRSPKTAPEREMIVPVTFLLR